MASGSTRVFAVLGDPVAHSLSPAMHEAAFRTLGLDATYVALRCAIAEVPHVMHALARQGGGGNVTVPFKSVAAQAVTAPSALVRELGACNTFWAAAPGDGEALGVAGDNTDVAGVLAALARLEVPEGPWLVTGTGGSAHAVAAAARQAGARLAVRSREPARARAFLGWAASIGVEAAEPEACVACINCTPIGLKAGDGLPIAPEELAGVRVALDLVYARGETRWVRELRKRGVRAADGREMLVAQGAAAFERWFPGKRAPLDAMRAAVHARLG